MNPSENTLIEAKKNLRVRARQLRNELARAAVPNLASMTLELLNIIRRHRARSLGGYFPIRGELDVLPLMSAVQMEGLETALPVVAARDEAMCFRRWQVGDTYVEGEFGVPVPAQGAEVIIPDALLVPGLAFDQHGGRLGYGGGYYDRTIGAIEASGNTVVTIGICYQAQLVDAVPREAHDRTLDYILYA